MDRLNSLIKILVILIVLGILFFGVYWFYKDKTTKNIGKQTVALMYDFSDANELKQNDSKLKEITTEETYTKLTATNEDRALRTYLKLSSGSKVEFIKSVATSNGGYVLYTIKSSRLSDGRKFLFLYDLEGDKVSNVREMECIDFDGGN